MCMARLPLRLASGLRPSRGVRTGAIPVHAAWCSRPSPKRGGAAARCHGYSTSQMMLAPQTRCLLANRRPTSGAQQAIQTPPCTVSTNRSDCASALSLLTGSRFSVVVLRARSPTAAAGHRGPASTRFRRPPHKGFAGCGALVEIQGASSTRHKAHKDSARSSTRRLYSLLEPPHRLTRPPQRTQRQALVPNGLRLWPQQKLSNSTRGWGSGTQSRSTGKQSSRWLGSGGVGAISLHWRSAYIGCAHRRQAPAPQTGPALCSGVDAGTSPAWARPSPSPSSLPCWLSCSSSPT